LCFKSQLQCHLPEAFLDTPSPVFCHIITACNALMSLVVLLCFLPDKGGNSVRIMPGWLPHDPIA
jgi:hypothetical protein